MVVLLPPFENQNIPTHCRKCIFMARQNPGRWRPEPNLAGQRDESINPGLCKENQDDLDP